MERQHALANDRVLPLLRGRFGAPYLWSEECRSTQDVLLHNEWSEGAVSVTEHQSGGRGRQRREWADSSGRSLLVSLLLRPSAGAFVEQLSLVVGLAAAEAIDAVAGTRSEIKWPNDVLVDGRKVAGILLESSRGAVVCGIGINVNQTETELPAATRLAAGSLRLASRRTHDRAELLAELLVTLERRYDEWCDDGLEPLLPQLERRDALSGSHVTVSGVSGIAAGIAADGRLQITQANGTVALVASGEVEQVPR